MPVSSRSTEVQQASATDYAEQYAQLDIVGLAHDVSDVMPRRCRTYNPTFSTAGVSAALARLDGWTWGHRYIVRHVLDLMGGLSVEGLDDAAGQPLPACYDTANQISEQLVNMSPGTVRNALSKACRQGILTTASGALRYVGACRKFYPGKVRGPRVIHPGPVLCLMLDEWAEVSPASDTGVTSQ